MTWSLTLAGLPDEWATSRAHHHQQIVQKMKDLSKTWIYRKNRLKSSDEEKVK